VQRRCRKEALTCEDWKIWTIIAWHGLSVTHCNFNSQRMISTEVGVLTELKWTAAFFFKQWKVWHLGSALFYTRLTDVSAKSCTLSKLLQSIRHKRLVDQDSLAAVRASRWVLTYLWLLNVQIGWMHSCESWEKQAALLQISIDQLAAGSFMCIFFRL